MALLSLSALLQTVTKTQIYQKGLDVAVALGLPVTSWSAGDPTRSLYYYLAEILETAEQVRAEYAASGFLDFARGTANAWLKLLAKQGFNVDAIEATFATTDVVLSNSGGGHYEIGVRELTFKNSVTDKTYTNITGGTLTSGPGTTLTVTVEADEAGADSSADPGDIDALVTTLLGVTCTNAAAAIGVDDESAASIVSRCRLKLGSLSPNGPRDAYVYVALTPELSGTTEVTRARSVGDSATGDVTLYVAGPAGAVSAPAVAAVQAGVEQWATPLCITPTVASAANETVAVTYELWLYTSVGQTSSEVEDAVEAALQAMFAVRPIGGDVISPDPGRLYKSMIESTIRAVFAAHAFRVTVSAPASDTDLLISEVAVLGTITPTVTFVEGP